ncbi:ribulose-bisphosphate carboxylase large subunit family protein [Granulosicoccus sp. 3-233]|uniref:ribulose-bisphosphate carboxylase large subunit family protein n=1 Tax=Granulosicoccus sp. 3-233 TaxID=3417969 RepID=UPI003D3458DB
MRIEADYLIETSDDPVRAAEIMAGEQSSGTFIAVPGETPELKERAAARIESLEVIGELNEPSLPGAVRRNGPIRKAAVTLSWPLANIGPSLPNLLATITGNLFELKSFSGLRIVDVRLPEEFAQVYSGPRFGIPGTRQLTGVQNGPLLGTIIKPSVGLDAQGTAAMVQQLAEAGIDFIKDDELQSDGPACPFEERARAVMDVINRHADISGKKIMYAFNITGDLDQMRRRHELIVSLGGSCVMASLNSVGLVGMIELGRFSELPIHAHRNGWGYLSRHPSLGWSYVAWQKIWRLAGADHMHVNGLRNKFCEDDDSVLASARACLTPMFDNKPCIAMPVFSSGQSAEQVEDTYAALGTTDLMYLAGGGIAGHPMGVAAGVSSLRQAWEAATSGVSLEDYARERPELASALDTYRQ